jgi:hypothetical protein
VPRHPIAPSFSSAVISWALLPLAFTFVAPASAQDAGASAQDASAPDSGERINQLIVYGDDPCPISRGDEITVCARKSENERFRIPAPLRESGDLQKNESWSNKVLAYETVGRTGTQSCSPVGAGGWTGCSNKLINNAYAEKRESSDVHFSELIQAERAKRLSTIDKDATATQSRVEDAERDYEARQRAQAAAPAHDRAAATVTYLPPAP